MPEYSPQEVMEAVNALKDTVKEYGNDSADTKQMIDKVEKTLGDFDKEKQDILLKAKADEKKLEDLETRYKTLESEMAKSGGKNKGLNYKDSDEYKALNDFVTKGIIDTKTLRMDDNTSGGALTMPEMDTEIIKDITEISPIRAVARVRSVTAKTLEMPKRTSIPIATYEGEAQQNTISTSKYGTVTETAYRLTVTTDHTLDMLGDARFDLMSEIQNDVVTDAFAFGEGNNFVLGDGVQKPEGFLVNAAVVADARVSAISANIEAKDLLLMTGDLKVGQNPIFGFNRQTLATIRTFTGTTNDHFIWQAGLAPNAPNTIGGVPYIVIQDMPSISANSLSVVLADFKRGYTIIDRHGLAIIRDDVTLARQATVLLTFHKWNTGKVTQPEAFKLLKTAP